MILNNLFVHDPLHYMMPSYNNDITLLHCICLGWWIRTRSNLRRETKLSGNCWALCLETKLSSSSRIKINMVGEKYLSASSFEFLKRGTYDIEKTRRRLCSSQAPQNRLQSRPSWQCFHHIYQLLVVRAKSYHLLMLHDHAVHCPNSGLHLSM